MVMAENQNGKFAPINRKAKVRGWRISTWLMAPAEAKRMRTTKAPYRARDTAAAEAMAKPLPTAAVVLPAASRASVFSRTYK